MPDYNVLSKTLKKYKLTDLAVNHIDGILIPYKTFSEHINPLTELLEGINIRVDKNIPVPHKTNKNIRQFLGKINFYHDYIPKRAMVLDPLHNLLRNKKVLEPFLKRYNLMEKKN